MTVECSGGCHGGFSGLRGVALASPGRVGELGTREPLWPLQYTSDPPQCCVCSAVISSSQLCAASRVLMECKGAGANKDDVLIVVMCSVFHGANRVPERARGHIAIGTAVPLSSLVEGNMVTV
jgi:hypothetical protein